MGSVSLWSKKNIMLNKDHEQPEKKNLEEFLKQTLSIIQSIQKFEAQSIEVKVSPLTGFVYTFNHN